MTGRRRNEPPPPPKPEGAGAPASGVWLVRGGPAGPAGVVWLVRPMPADQWPPNWDEPRNDTFRWLVRSHCGHPGGSQLWAFVHECDARAYETVFRDNPCYHTRCQKYLTKIKNEGETQ